MAYLTPRLLTAAAACVLGLLAPIAGAQDAPAPARVDTPSAAAPRRSGDYDGPPLLLGRRTAVGGYGGGSAAYTHMLGRSGALLGLEGALLVAHKLSLGLAGYGFARAPAGPPASDGGRRNLGTGYGGLLVRYAPFDNLPVYPAIGVLIGGGAVVLQRDDDFDHHAHGHDTQSDGFFVVQPELTVHANLTRWMRVGANVGYRVTSGVHRFGLKESDLNGVVVGGQLQFGWL